MATLTWEQARQAIYAHFIAGWAGQLDYFLEGQAQPDLTTRTTSFVTLCVEPGRTEQIAMRGNKPPLRSYGSVEVTVFLSATAGAKVRMTAIDKLIQMFAAQVAGDLTFQTVHALSMLESKNWRSQTVIASFYFEQTNL